jgi:hypothetical protein
LSLANNLLSCGIPSEVAATAASKSNWVLGIGSCAPTPGPTLGPTRYADSAAGERQARALSLLYNSTAGPNWQVRLLSAEAGAVDPLGLTVCVCVCLPLTSRGQYKNGWMAGDPCTASWSMVICEAGAVVGLDLSYQSLQVGTSCR